MQGVVRMVLDVVILLDGNSPFNVLGHPSYVVVICPPVVFLHFIPSVVDRLQ